MPLQFPQPCVLFKIKSVQRTITDNKEMQVLPHEKQLRSIEFFSFQKTQKSQRSARSTNNGEGRK